VLDENDSLEAAHHAPKWVKFSPLVAGLLGIFMAYLIYMTGPGVPEKVRRAVPALHALSFNKWYFDEIYDYLFVRRAFGFGRRIFTKADRKIIDRFGPDGGANGVRRHGQNVQPLPDRLYLSICIRDDDRGNFAAVVVCVPRRAGGINGRFAHSFNHDVPAAGRRADHSHDPRRGRSRRAGTAGMRRFTRRCLRSRSRFTCS
jgi:hypothetical protein